jgi:hypothetical protein
MIMQNCTKETKHLVCLYESSWPSSIEVEAKSPRFESEVEIFFNIVQYVLRATKCLLMNVAKDFQI